MAITVILIVVFAVSNAVANQVRPCHFAHHDCIGKDLAANTKCNRNVRGVIPAEYTLAKFLYDTAHFNSSYTEHNLKIRNHNRCFIAEFFYNFDTSSIVIGIECRGLEFQANRTLTLHRTFNEDMEFGYRIHAVYPAIRLTVHLQKSNNYDICKAFVFTDVVALPTFKIDPNDIRTDRVLTKDLTELNVFERETFYWRGGQLARFYINSLICDFGCDF